MPYGEHSAILSASVARDSELMSSPPARTMGIDEGRRCGKSLCKTANSRHLRRDQEVAALCGASVKAGGHRVFLYSVAAAAERVPKALFEQAITLLVSRNDSHEEELPRRPR